ncbi:MAG: hypothetical protein ABI467_13035 [Kofleriaceae bacterium]
MMRTARAKIIKGKVVTKAKFPEGTKLLLVVDEPQPEVELDDEDVEAIRRARASIRAGRKVPMDLVFLRQKPQLRSRRSWRAGTRTGRPRQACSRTCANAAVLLGLLAALWVRRYSEQVVIERKPGRTRSGSTRACRPTNRGR